MRPATWFGELLNNRGILKPDGRPLYQYRLTEQEYDSLSSLLKTSSVFDLKTVQSVLHWDVVFVLYASEWIRRHYDGNWGWKDLFGIIGFDHNSIQTTVRNRIVEDGLRQWGRQVREINGSRKFLGTILTEGGLPLNQLKNGSWILNVLAPSLEAHLKRGSVLSNEVENRADIIPSSFRHDGLITMLVDICAVIAKLREEHKLAGQAEPWLVLDKAVQNWRDIFPLPLNNDHAENLLKVLLKLASEESAENAANYYFEQVTELKGVSTGQAEVISRISNPQFLLLDSPELSGITTANITIELLSADKKSIAWCKAIKIKFGDGRDALKIIGKPKLLDGQKALTEYTVIIKSTGQQVAQLDIANSIALPVNQPWLFFQKDGKYVLKGTASQRIDAASVYVYVPNQAQLSPVGEDSTYIHFMSLSDGDFYQLNGTVDCVIEDSKYRLSSRSSDVSLRYLLTGKTLAIESTPEAVFIGKPVAIQIDDNGLRVFGGTTSVSLELKPTAINTPWSKLTMPTTGVYEARLIDNQGFTLLRRRIGILPEAFSYSAESDKQSPLLGSLFFNGLGGLPAISGDHVRNVSVIETSAANFRVDLEAKDSPPRTSTIEIQNSKHIRPLRLKIPFPAKGLMLFDASEQLIPTSSQININRLEGYRLSLFVGDFAVGRWLEIKFFLTDTDMPSFELNELQIVERFKAENNHVEFKLVDWQEQISSLLTVSENIDSFVQVEIVVSGKSYPRIQVRRYRDDLETNFDMGHLSLSHGAFYLLGDELLERLEPLCIRINAPQENTVALESIRSEGAHTGKWDFRPNSRKSGPWLIYPSADSIRQFRPLLWNVDSDDNQLTDGELTTLMAASCVEDSAQRMKTIDAILNNMITDSKHASWAYLDDLWEKTAHLPMTTFDVWKVASRNDEFLAVLQFRGSLSICEKLGHDFSISWESIRFETWLNVFSESLKDLEVQVGDPEFAREIMIKRINQVDIFNGALLAMKLHFLSLNGVELPDAVLYRKPHDETRLNMIIAECHAMRLRHSDSRWPEYLNNRLNSTIRDLAVDYPALLNIQNNYQESVFYLPIVLAYKFVHPESVEMALMPADYFKIYRLKQFDEEWFSLVFHFVSGNLIANLEE